MILFVLDTWIRTKSAFSTITSRNQSRQDPSTTSTSTILSQELSSFTSEAITSSTSSMEKSPDIGYTHTTSVFNDKVNWRQDHKEASYDTIDNTLNNDVNNTENINNSNVSFWQNFLFLFTIFSSITSVKAISTGKTEKDKEYSAKITTIFGSLNIFNGLKNLLSPKKKKRTGKYSNLRRSRRLAGLPPEIVEELRKARRIRRMERQISSGGTANDDIQDDNIPDQDDEELLEQIIQQKEAEEDCEIEDHGHLGSLIAKVVLLPVTVIFSSWSILRSFFKSSRRTGIRRSRRLLGLSPEIIEEIKKARKIRRIQQNQSEGLDMDEDIIDNNDTLDEHDEKLIEQLLQTQDFEIEDHGHLGLLIVSILTFPFTTLDKFWKYLTSRTKTSKYGELRRSRRLQGFPAEIIEELKQARRQRRIERQLGSGMSAIIEDDSVPDQDDDILIENILTRKENEEINSSNTLMSKIMSIILLPFPFINWLYHYVFRKTNTSKYAELRRSRRLQGLPAEIIDELKIARRRRRLERQFSCEAMADSILDDSIPDKDDEQLIDEILTRKEQEELEKATFGTLIKSIVRFPFLSISSMLKGIFTSRSDRRRSRRLQGLPPHIFEELQATKRQRKAVRLQNNPNDIFDANNELSQNEENEIIDQLLIKHNITETDIVKESFVTNCLTHFISLIFLPVTISQTLLSRICNYNYNLENLPTEIMEKLQGARRQRRIERQKLNGEGGDILDDNLPDQDDNELLEQIINDYEHVVPKQSYLLGSKPFDNQPINATDTITGLFSSFYTWMFNNKTLTKEELELRRSRRLQGLPPDVLEELMKARRQRRILRQKLDPNYVIVDDNISDLEDEALLAQIITDKEYVVPKEAKLIGKI